MKVLSFEKQISYYAILGFICFIFIYALDAIKVLSDKFLFILPFGFIGLILSLFLVVPFFYLKRDNFLNGWILSFFTIVIALIVLSISSTYFEWLDLWNYFKLFIAAPIVGYFTAMFFAIEKVTKKVMNLIITILLVLSILVFIFHFNRNNFLDTNYLRFAESIFLISVFLMVYLKNTTHKIILTILTLVLLFLSESRFVLFSFIIISFVYFSLYSLKSLLLLYFLVFIVLGFVLIYDYNLLADSRFARILFNTSQDTSLNARSELLEKGFSISEFYTISGRYAYFREECTGCYAHNFLSLWFEFGFIGVCFILYLLYSFFMGFSKLFKKFIIKRMINNFEMFYFLLSIHVLIGFIISKHWSYFTLFFVLGMTFFIINKKEIASIKPNS